MNRPKAFVVQPIPETALAILREAAEVTVYPYLDRQVSEGDLVAAARRSDWPFVMHKTNVTAAVFEANPALCGIGALAKFDPRIGLEAARRHGVPILVEDPADNAFGGVSLTTADLTVGMLLSLAYRLGEADRYTRCGRFRQEQTMALMGLGCLGKTAGLIGFGRVAEYMAPRLRAFDTRVSYTTRTRLDPAREHALGIAWRPSLDGILSESDFVCIACDYNPSTHKLIGRRELG